VTVSGGGTSVAVDGKTATNGVFTLEVASPAINGIVQKPSDSARVPNSWVVPTNRVTNEQLWQMGANTNSSGQFGIAVPDGAYDVTAQVPWNSGYNLAKSAPCSVTVLQGSVSTPEGGCVQANHSIVLTLRAPNLTFKVVNRSNVALPNANVSIQFGAWSVWASADDAGQVSMFIDPAEIKAANPNAHGPISLSAYIEPPYGNSDVVRSQCTQVPNDADTLCARLRSITLPDQLNGSYSPYLFQDLDKVQMAAPNTTLTVTRPDNSIVGAGAWVTVFKSVNGCSQCREYVASSNTSTAGRAAFNILNPESATYILEVNAPNAERGTYAMNTYTGLTWAELNGHSFHLETPTLRVIVKQPNGSSLAKWSWMSVESLDGSNLQTGWLGGYGTNDQATAAAVIPADGRFRLTFYPGGGSAGARTTCIITTTLGQVSRDATDCTNGTLTGSDLVVTLSLGNFTGTVKHNGGLALAGAIVRAEWAGDTNNVQQAQTFTTGADGKYGFQLLPGAWLIKVFYVDDPDSGFTIRQEIAGRAVTVGNTNNPFDITLVG